MEGFQLSKYAVGRAFGLAKIPARFVDFVFCFFAMESPALEE